MAKVTKKKTNNVEVETKKVDKTAKKGTTATKKQSLGTITEKGKGKTVDKTGVKTKKKTKVNNDEFSVSVGRLALKNAVDLVSDALPSKDYGDAKSGIFMETKYVDDEPMLFLTANSLNVFISHGIKLQNDIGEGFVVPKGNDLKKIVKGLQSLKSHVDMSFDSEENQLLISCGDNYNGTIQHYDVTGFVFPPTIEDIKSNDVITLPVKFIQEALSKVAFACSTDDTIPELTGVLIEQDNNSINIVGGDGNRLSYLTIKSKVKNPKSVIIGVKFLSLFNNILKTLEIKATDILTLYLSEEKIYFVVENTIVGIQVFAGEYPIEGGYEQFVIAEEDCEITLELEKAKFLEKLDLAVLHNNSSMDPITMSVSKGKCKLSNSPLSSNKFNIDFEVQKVKNESDSKEVDIMFTPEYLYDVVKCLDDKEFILSFQSEQGPAIVRPMSEKDGEYIHVFSLN